MVSPLELLTNDPDRIPSVAEKIWAPTMGAMLGFGAACFMNWGTRRPLMAGLQTHVILTTVGGFLAQNIDERRNRYLAERDAVIRRYVELHPEDFPTPPRKKYADVLEPWIPVR